MITATNSLLSVAVLYSAASPGPGSVELGSVSNEGILVLKLLYHGCYSVVLRGAVPCRAVLCRAVPYCAAAVLCYDVLCCAVLFAILCSIICYAILYYAVLCCAMLCYAMLYRAVLYGDLLCFVCCAVFAKM